MRDVLKIILFVLIILIMDNMIYFVSFGMEEAENFGHMYFSSSEGETDDGKCLDFSLPDEEAEDDDFLDFSSLDESMEDKCDISFSTIYDCIKKGDINGLAEHIMGVLSDGISYEIKNNSKFMIMILGVIMLGSIFSGLSGKFMGYASEGGFFVTYLALISILLSTFVLMYEVAYEVIDRIIDFIQLFIPVYTLSSGYACGDKTAAMSYEIMIFIIYICENIIMYLVFPLAKCFCIIGLVNKLNKEDFFSKTAGLIKSAALWILKGILTFITGFNIIKGLISPSMDRLSRNSIYKAISMMPGGGGVSAIAGILVSSGSLIQNSIGMAGAVAVIIISMVPVIKMWIIFISLKVVAALVQPLGDKRFSEGVDIMAKTADIMLKSVLTSVLMYLISVTLMCMLAR